MIMASKQNSDFIKIDGVTHKFQTDTGELPVLNNLNQVWPRIALPLSWVLLDVANQQSRGWLLVYLSLILEMYGLRVS